MKEQMRIELHNETEYTERISFQDIWTHASRLKYAGCRVAAITDRNSVDGIHMAEHDFMRRGIQPIYGVTLSCIDVDDRYDVVLLAANLTGRDNIFRLIELLESNRFSFGRAVTREQLDARILREFEAGPNKQFKNVIGVLFPSSLTPVMLELGGIPAEKKIHDISREERQHFIDLIKAFPFTITGMGEFKEAIITRGGVSVKEINPGTMESKKISGLYFAGEVLDLDAVTGGYNLQIAWSTAYLAAQAIQ